MSISDNVLVKATPNLQESITGEQIKFFLDNGFLVIKQVLKGAELQAIQDEILLLYQEGASGVENDPDYFYGKGVKSGKKVLRRIEYVISKSEQMRLLLAHPFILYSVEKLQGQNFIPTWDAMVVKVPDEGIIVPWHRDATVPEGCNDRRPIFNVDFYLDQADLKSCLWVIPGSHLWTLEQADERCALSGFNTDDAIPVPLEAGDVIFHNIQLLHGSPSGDGNALRRTIYFEFRPGEIEMKFGPHTLEYLSLKQHLLLECIRQRSQSLYTVEEQPFNYSPKGAFAIGEARDVTNFRYAHQQFWR